MRRRFSWTRVVAILALLAGAFAYAMLPGSSTFTVSTETTYVTGPLDKYGYVDYVTALNERLSKGVRPENNANVLIWQALGPRPEGAEEAEDAKNAAAPKEPVEGDGRREPREAEKRRRKGSVTNANDCGCDYAAGLFDLCDRCLVSQIP
jgi:hypothetical protein